MRSGELGGSWGRRRMEEGVGGGRPQDEGEGVSVHVGESAGLAKEGCAAVEQADVFAEGREEGKVAGGRDRCRRMRMQKAEGVHTRRC